MVLNFEIRALGRFLHVLLKIEYARSPLFVWILQICFQPFDCLILMVTSLLISCIYIIYPFRCLLCFASFKFCEVELEIPGSLDCKLVWLLLLTTVLIGHYSQKSKASLPCLV